MAVALTIEVKERFVMVTAQGEFELEQAKQEIFKVIDICHKNQIARVLNDVREVKGSLDLMDRYEYVLFLVGGIKQHFSHLLDDIRLAYVGPRPEGDVYTPQVVQQSGVNIMSTDNMEEAIQWIEKDSI